MLLKLKEVQAEGALISVYVQTEPQRGGRQVLVELVSSEFLAPVSPQDEVLVVLTECLVERCKSLWHTAGKKRLQIDYFLEALRLTQQKITCLWLPLLNERSNGLVLARGSKLVGFYFCWRTFALHRCY